LRCACKTQEAFYQRSSTTRGTAQNSSYPSFAARTTLQQNELQLAQMNGFNEEDINSVAEWLARLTAV